MTAFNDACECCGSTSPLSEVRVRHRRTEEAATLRLCQRCHDQDRTWRLQWEEVEDR